MGGIDAWVHATLLRLPGGAWLARLQNRIASFVEQGLQGVGNLLVSAALARSLGRDEFAVIGLMLGIHYFLLGVHRSAIVLPYILDTAHHAHEAAELENGWWWFNLLGLGALVAAMAVFAGLLTAVGHAYPASAWFGRAAWLVAMVSPVLLFAEFGRRVLYQRQLPATAALASAVYLALNLGLGIVLGRATGSAAWSALSWVAGGLGAAAITMLAVPPGRFAPGVGAQHFRAHRQFIFWQVLNNVPFAAYTQSAVVLVGLFGGQHPAAAFTATRTLTNPSASIVTAVDTLDKPRAARGLAQGGLAGLRGSVNRTRRTLLLLCGGYLGLLALFAGPVLHFAYGATYDNEVNEIRVLAFAFFLMCLNQPSETFLIVLRASRTMFVIRCMTCAVMLACMVLARPYGLLGICTALAVTQAMNLISLRLAEVFAARRWVRATGVAPVPDGRTVQAVS